MENVCIFAKVVMIGKSRIEQDKVFRSLLNAFFFSKGDKPSAEGRTL